MKIQLLVTYLLTKSFLVCGEQIKDVFLLQQEIVVSILITVCLYKE